MSSFSMIINGPLVNCCQFRVLRMCAQQTLRFQAWVTVFPVEALCFRESILHDGKLLLRIIQSQSKYHF